MKRILLLLILMFNTISYGQSFEGKLTYKVDFEVKTEQFSKAEIIEYMKKSGDYYDSLIVHIKDGNYEKLVNSGNSKRIVYKSDVNKIYTFDSGFEYVIITNAKNHSSTTMEIEKPQIIQNNSLVTIMEKECKSITLDWNGLGKETYFYNSEFLQIDPQLFAAHNFEYLNEILAITKSYPTQITKSLNNMLEVKMTLVDYSKEKISDSAFEIPELQPAEKEYSDMIMETTGNEVMRLKN